MFSPDQSTFATLAAQFGMVPLSREIIADFHTPLTVFATLAAAEPNSFLFESMEGGEKWGRYSFIGFDPLLAFESRGDEIVITENGVQRTLHGNPLETLRRIISDFRPALSPELPRFAGGGVGYLGYDMVRFMERLPERLPPIDLPDSSFIVPGTVLVYDNLRQTLQLVRNVRVRAGSDSTALYRQAQDDIDVLVRRLERPAAASASSASSAPHAFTSNVDCETFCEQVRRAKQYIQDGDIIQVVLSQRFHTETDLDPLSLYRALRHINPSPYLFFLKLGDLIQIGSSPEILVRLEGDEIELRPIAGTRQRGKTADEDRRLAEELLADPKERAEHLMLVDLGRNDVGRVAAPGSVEVRDLLVIERYSHVMHIVSGVHGRLTEGRDQFDVVSACFPAGTVTGAPKIRAMEIIEELETQRRGPYAGAVGYFGFSGNMDFCITIRTMILCGRHLWIQAGAGIVADSDPESEYQETINKGMALRRAVELAERGLT